MTVVKSNGRLCLGYVTPSATYEGLVVSKTITQNNGVVAYLRADASRTVSAGQFACQTYLLSATTSHAGTDMYGGFFQAVCRSTTSWDRIVGGGFRVAASNNSTGGDGTYAAGVFQVDVEDYTSITTAHGCLVEAFEIDTGSITNAIGIEVEDIAIATNNWAILTNAGNVTFNEGGDANSDFRVESDSYDAINVDSGDNELELMKNAAGKIGFFGATPVVQRAKADYNNWAAFTDVVDALVDLGLFDVA
jgi:hypothetical protein